MSYSERINASEQKALSRIVATKIDREMKELRGLAESSPSARRRWGWELLQNAKDVHNGSGVSVTISYEDAGNALSFRHTGRPFSADNIRFLIEQISTKDREVDENGLRKETGRFGTGFLSTHLLSEKVLVAGVAKEPDLEHKQFCFLLDRSGTSLPEITAAVASAKQAVANLDSLPKFEQYAPTSFNTTFKFALTDSLSHEVASAGLDDLCRCLPITLVHVPELKSVDLSPLSKQFRRSYDGTIENTEVRITQVEVVSNSSEKDILSFATATKGMTSVSVPVVFLGGVKYRLCSINNKTPRLFCDFPLVGSEVFPFPAIINNPHFDPTDPRDGVYLNDTIRGNEVVLNNQTILAEAIDCYKVLAGSAIQGGWEDLHLLADVKPFRSNVDWVSRSWLDANIAKPVRRIISQQSIVTTAKGPELSPILDWLDDPEIWFPAGSTQKTRGQIWSLAAKWFPENIPCGDHVEVWHPLIWDKCGSLDSEAFCERVEKAESVDRLADQLSDRDWVTWLNAFYEMLRADESNTDSLVHHKSIFPNQLGEFCLLDSLHYDVGDTEEELKEILLLLGSCVRERLADRRIDFRFLETGKLTGRTSLAE